MTMHQRIGRIGIFGLIGTIFLLLAVNSFIQGLSHGWEDSRALDLSGKVVIVVSAFSAALFLYLERPRPARICWVVLVVALAAGLLAHVLNLGMQSSR